MQPDPAPRPSETRRKVLQGTLAAPVVLTVSSASASVTSFGKCLVGQKTAPGPFFHSTADTWLRKEVPVVKLRHGRDQGWFYFDPGKNDFVRLSNPGVASGIGALMQGWHKEDESTRWALVWVESRSGSPFSIMQVQQPLGYQATTKSCYTSLIKAQ